MPLFRRPDGDLVRDLPADRRMMQYLMPRRNDAAVYHEQNVDLGRTRPWLRAYNRARPGRVGTLFGLYLWACGRALHEWPGINRFASGRRLYQRRGAFITFAAKQEMTDQAPFRMIKLEIPREEPFDAWTRRVAAAVGEARGDALRPIDREVALLTRLPGWLLRCVVAAGRWLDAVNLFPRSMIAPDPLFTSMVLSNIGSAGLEDAYHHLHEYGTASAFGMVGRPLKQLVVGRDGTPVVRVGLQVRWTADERIADGLYFRRSLERIREIVEDPERHVRPPAPARPTGP